MAMESGAYRWWENYLVRYLMPSIAGAVIVSWLTSGNPELKQLLHINTSSPEIESTTLILLFLYGNLFCYIASYPILGFHVTRVIDFDDSTWKVAITDGYISSLLVAALVVLVCALGSKGCTYKWAPFAIVIAFSVFQLYRISKSLERIKFEGLTGKVTRVYAYTYSLARRRGIVEEASTTKQTSKDQTDDDSGDKYDEEKEWQKKSIWRREFIDSYRHMREHGNSAFIFVLELVLAGLCYMALASSEAKGDAYQLSTVGVLLALWTIPSVFIHFVGQHIERRFSWYDKKVS